MGLLGGWHRQFALALICLGALFAGCASDGSQQSRGTQLIPGTPEFTARCQKWIDQKGYPRDYIEQRTGGKVQPGPALQWKGNVPVAEVKANDVVVTQRITRDQVDVIAAGYVDAVSRDPQGRVDVLTISAIGRAGSPWVDRDCQVGPNFGRVVTERIPISMVIRVWRTDLPLP